MNNKLSYEHGKLLSEVRVALRELGATENQETIIKNDLTDMMIEAQSRSENIADSISDPFVYAQELIQSMPKDKISNHVMDIVSSFVLFSGVYMGMLILFNLGSIGEPIKIQLYTIITLVMFGILL